MVDYNKTLKDLQTPLSRNADEGCWVAPVLGDNGNKYRINNLQPSVVDTFLQSFNKVKTVILQCKNNHK